MIRATEARELTNKTIRSYTSQITSMDESIKQAIDSGIFHTSMTYTNTQNLYKLKCYYEDLGYKVIIDDNRFELNW